MVLAGDLVPAGTMLVTIDVDYSFLDVDYSFLLFSNIRNWYEAPAKNLNKFVSGGAMASLASLWLRHWVEKCI